MVIICLVAMIENRLRPNMNSDLADNLPDLSHLTEQERSKIVEVLRKDETLRSKLNDKFL